MAYDIIIHGAFSGRPAYRGQLYVRRNAVSGNSSSYGWELRGQQTGSGTTWTGNLQPWAVNIGPANFGGSTTLPFNTSSDFVIGSGTTGYFAHDASGNLTVWCEFAINASGELFGVANAGAYFYTDRIASVPPAPVVTGFGTNPDQIGPTSMRFRFSSTGDGGSPILEWQAQRATNSAFSDAVQVSSSGTTVFTGLTPGVTYYFRARGRNANGVGPFSAVVSGTTLSVTPPTLAVVPALSGLSATLTITPPSTVTTVDKYVVERRVAGTTTPVVTYNIPSSPYVATDVSAGVTYEWRASLVIGTYQSGWSAWVTAVQPAPNTNPGDYFDGSTPDKTDIDYRWTGTVNLSTSTANGKAVTGWIADGSVSAVLYRQTGGRSQSFAARVVVMRDGVNPGDLAAGTSYQPTGRAEAVAGGTYFGSIHVQLPNRSQRMAAYLIWINAAGAVLSSSPLGDSAVVAQSTVDWVRLSVSAVAPAGTAFAAVYATGAAGTGFTPWLAGDVLVLDDAMLTVGAQYPYFDGNTPDSGIYVYGWLGAENASVSTRTSLPQSATDPFEDPDCDPVPSPPTPPPVDDSCIVETGVWRRYWASIADQNVARWLAEIPTIRLSTGAVAARQVRIRIWENPDGLTPDQYLGSDWVSEQIISYMPPNSIYVLDGVSETVVGSVDDGVTWQALDHLLYGTDGTPATWPVLRCGIGYLISFDVPVDAPEGNLTVETALTRRY